MDGAVLDYISLKKKQKCKSKFQSIIILSQSVRLAGKTSIWNEYVGLIKLIFMLDNLYVQNVENVMFLPTHLAPIVMIDPTIALDVILNLKYHVNI